MGLRHLLLCWRGQEQQEPAQLQATEPFRPPGASYHVAAIQQHSTSSPQPSRPVDADTSVVDVGVLLSRTYSPATLLSASTGAPLQSQHEASSAAAARPEAFSGPESSSSHAQSDAAVLPTDLVATHAPFAMTGIALEAGKVYQNAHSTWFYGDLNQRQLAPGDNLAMSVLRELFQLEGEEIVEEVLDTVTLMSSTSTSGASREGTTWRRVIRVPYSCQQTGFSRGPSTHEVHGCSPVMLASQQGSLPSPPSSSLRLMTQATELGLAGDQRQSPSDYLGQPSAATAACSHAQLSSAEGAADLQGGHSATGVAAGGARDSRSGGANMQSASEIYLEESIAMRRARPMVKSLVQLSLASGSAERFEHRQSRDLSAATDSPKLLNHTLVSTQSHKLLKSRLPSGLDVQARAASHAGLPTDSLPWLADRACMQAEGSFGHQPPCPSSGTQAMSAGPLQVRTRMAAMRAATGSANGGSARSRLRQDSGSIELSQAEQAGNGPVMRSAPSQQGLGALMHTAPLVPVTPTITSGPSRPSTEGASLPEVDAGDTDTTNATALPSSGSPNWPWLMSSYGAGHGSESDLGVQGQGLATHTSLQRAHTSPACEEAQLLHMLLGSGNSFECATNSSPQPLDSGAGAAAPIGAAGTRTMYTSAPGHLSDSSRSLFGFGAAGQGRVAQASLSRLEEAAESLERRASTVSGCSDGSGDSDVVGRAAADAQADCLYHEVVVMCIEDSLKSPVLMIYQTDVTVRTQLEVTMAGLTEAQLTTLTQIFPRHVVEFLSVGRPLSKPADLGHLACTHQDVSIMFLDVVGFTSMSEQVAASAVMTFLNSLFSVFDDLCTAHGVHKVETAGDCYIVSSGLVTQDAEGFNQVATSHDPKQSAARLLRFAKALLAASHTVLMPHNKTPVKVRIGLHTGPCVSGVVGSKLPKFGVFGDTMNTASRMESTCTPGRIQVSAATHALLLASGESYPTEWEATGGIEVKGKGVLDTYLWVEPQDAAAPEHASPADHAMPRTMRATTKVPSGDAGHRVLDMQSGQLPMDAALELEPLMPPFCGQLLVPPPAEATSEPLPDKGRLGSSPRQGSAPGSNAGLGGDLVIARLARQARVWQEPATNLPSAQLQVLIEEASGCGWTSTSMGDALPASKRRPGAVPTDELMPRKPSSMPGVAGPRPNQALPASPFQALGRLMHTAQGRLLHRASMQGAHSAWAAALPSAGPVKPRRSLERLPAVSSDPVLLHAHAREVWSSPLDCRLLEGGEGRGRGVYVQRQAQLLPVARSENISSQILRVLMACPDAMSNMGTSTGSSTQLPQQVL